MVITNSGRQYICQNFGNTSLCCIDTGLSWYYTVGGTDYPETGGTAQVVSRLASGLITSLTMTNPARGTFTQAQLNQANGEPVTLPDCQTIPPHDTPAEEQWCYIPPSQFHITDTKTTTINIIQHANCIIENIVAPTQIEIAVPFTITYDCINNGETDVCCGHALIGGTEITGTRWDETINAGATRHCQANISGISQNTQIIMEVGYS